MFENVFDEVVRYVRFEVEHQEALREFRSVAEPHFGAMVHEFYERTSEHEAARLVFKGPEQVQRLKISLSGWLLRLLEGPWDQDYYQLRAQIGRMHVKVGLPQRFMFTGISHIREMLHELAVANYKGAKLCHVRTSINRILDVELAIMLETYREDSMAAVTRVQQLEAELLQRRLRITEARYQAIIEAAEVLVVAADPAGHVVLFNRKAEEITGFSRSELVQLELLSDLHPKEDWDRLRSAMAAALAGGNQPPLVARLFSRSGDEHWIRWHVTTLASAGDPFVCALGVDQTEERALEDQTRRAERLASLGTLAAGLAHEIRNPLNAAQLQLLLVERRLRKVTDRSVEPALNAASVVKGELARLGGLVEDFLSFAKPSSLRLSSGDLSATVRGVVELLEPDFKASGVEVSAREDGPVAARYDDERIRQILHNLVRNALEAAGSGGTVKVHTFRNRNRGVIEVSDTGGGPPDGLDLFQPFETSKDSGTGLGLSIVHRIVTDHAGSVAWHRRDGQTVFRVELPIEGPSAVSQILEPRSSTSTD